MAKKNVSLNFQGHTIKTVFDFNSEDLGLSFTTTISKDEFFELVKSESGRNLIAGISSEGSKALKSALGASGYKKYICEYIEDLSESLSKRFEDLEKDEIVTKSVISEKGVITSYLNGTKVESCKLPKDLVEKTLRAYREIVGI